MHSGVTAHSIPVLPSTLRVETIDGDGFARHFQELLPVYLRVFELSTEQSHLTRARIQAHSNRKNFKSILVFDACNQIAAFAYGYVGRTGEYFNDLVREKLLAAYGTDVANYWLADVFEVVEVAVDAPFRGKGFGDLILTELLKDVDARTALLAVRTDNERAINLYAKHGWEQLLPSVRFPNELTPYMVMGLRVSQQTA